MNKHYRVLSCFLLVAFVLFPAAWVFAGKLPSDAIKLRCKYSVRDVGFVDVHPFAWQLNLLRPDQLTSDQFTELDQQIRKLADGSNVGVLWYRKEGDGWKNHVKKQPNLPANAVGTLSNSNGSVIPIVSPQQTAGKSDQIINSVTNIFQSKLRQKVMRSCAESLCCIVLVECGVPSTDDQARQLLDRAIQSLKQQMWSLEKPTENGPAGLIVPAAERKKEKWLLTSMGLSGRNRQPTFVILYGRGRRLGELIEFKPGDAQQESTDQQKRLIARAAVCGGDCECDLDRDWLYGHQIWFRWTESLERTANATLDFDVGAAYVRSEVAAIVRKPSRGKGNTDIVNLGPGLIIHDLAPIERKTNLKKRPEHEEEIDKSDQGKQGGTQLGNAELATDGKLNSVVNGNNESGPITQSNPSSVGKSEANGTHQLQNENPDPNAAAEFPVTLIITLAILVSLTIIITWVRGK